MHTHLCVCAVHASREWAEVLGGLGSEGIACQL